MVGSENQSIDNAVVAQIDEIEKLSLYLSSYQCPRLFSKSNDMVPQHASSRPALEAESGSRRALKPKPPYQHLKEELALLLGICASQLVERTWRHYQLSPSDSEPHKLRFALHTLFSTAARLAAPRGNSGALKALVRGFEARYFALGLAASGNNSGRAHRFDLLATIRAGNGAHLLLTLLADQSSCPRPPAEVSLTARRADQDTLRRRRKFLMESASRSKNWTEAYRQTRLLGLGSLSPRLKNHPCLAVRIQTLCMGASQGVLPRVTK